MASGVKYRTIVADPPWEYPEGFVTLLGEGPRADGARRAMQRKSMPLPYPSMTLDAIKALPVEEMADRGAHLFLWTTNKWLPDAFAVAESWGFQYRQLLVWMKERHSAFVRSVAPNNCEYLLVCRRGSLPWQGSLPCNLVEIGWSPNDARRKHSRKPEAFLDIVEQVSPGPYLELFARRQRLGWDTWGDEALEHVEMGVA
jgi:N6-adenosine-specific RNA methylase IME4